MRIEIPLKDVATLKAMNLPWWNDRVRHRLGLLALGTPEVVNGSLVYEHGDIDRWDVCLVEVMLSYIAT